MQNIADIRKDYTKASLDIETVLSDPIEQFKKWFQEALESQVNEPNAMTLSTVKSDGRPSARIMLLKGVHEPPSGNETTAPALRTMSPAAATSQGFSPEWM